MVMIQNLCPNQHRFMSPDTNQPSTITISKSRLFEIMQEQQKNIFIMGGNKWMCTALYINFSAWFSIWRLVEDTFTVDEVREMLDGLQMVVRGEVEMELINAAHTNVLLLRQIFSQAEKFYLRLQSDISELENRWAEKTLTASDGNTHTGIQTVIAWEAVRIQKSCSLIITALVDIFQPFSSFSYKL